MGINPPIQSYFDAGIMAAETDHGTSHGVRYVGHALMAPAEHDYIVPPTTDEGYILFNRGTHHDLVSNVCRHRQARLLTGSGNTKHIVCKLHCWRYDQDGTLRTTPHYKGPRPGNLARRTLTNWNGLLFDGRPPALDLAAEGLADMLDFDGYVYAGSETETLNYNWKTFSEIYLDNYHVSSVHPGLRRYVDLDDLHWSQGADYSIQRIGLTKHIDRAGSAAFKPWHEALQRRFAGALPRWAALWIYIYPNLMVEWYPDMILVSTIVAEAPQRCINRVEYYFPKAAEAADPDYFAAARLAQAEVAREDDAACQLQSIGRRALLARGEDDGGPCHPELEVGVDAFYRFLQPVYRGA